MRGALRACRVHDALFGSQVRLQLGGGTIAFTNDRLSRVSPGGAVLPATAGDPRARASSRNTSRGAAPPGRRLAAAASTRRPTSAPRAFSASSTWPGLPTTRRPSTSHPTPSTAARRTASTGQQSLVSRAQRAAASEVLGRLQLPALRNASTAEASLGSLLKVAVHRANVAVARDLAAREPSCLTATPHGGAVLRCLAAADQPAGDFAEAVCAALAHHWWWRGEGGTSPSGAVRLPATQPPSPPVAWLPMPPIGVSLQFKVCPSGSSANGSVWLTLAEAKCGGGEAAE